MEIVDNVYRKNNAKVRNDLGKIKKDVRAIIAKGNVPDCKQALLAEHLTREQEESEDKKKAEEEKDMFANLNKFEEDTTLEDLKQFADKRGIIIEPWETTSTSMQIKQFASGRSAFLRFKRYSNVDRALGIDVEKKSKRF